MRFCASPDPSVVAWNVRSTALRTASTASAAPEPCLSFFFLSFLAMARVYSPHACSRPVHLRPHADVAERVLLPGDPGRALRLAQQLLDAPKMLNHNRGLWGYTGAAADGELLTIQSTGLGGPSTAIVVEELIVLGARRLVRVGTCGALVELELGSLVVAETVHARDGRASPSARPARSPPTPPCSPRYTLRANGATTGIVRSGDLYYGADASAGDAVAVD